MVYQTDLYFFDEASGGQAPSKLTYMSHSNGQILLYFCSFSSMGKLGLVMDSRSEIKIESYAYLHYNKVTPLYPTNVTIKNKNEILKDLQR